MRWPAARCPFRRRVVVEGGELIKTSIHLTFAGECEAAFEHYARCLGGTIKLMLKYAQSPMAGDVPEEWREKIVHAHLEVGQAVFAGADVQPKDYQAPQGFYCLLDIADPAEAERVFHCLAEDGTVKMAIQETFWAKRFGVLVDRFGTPWEINCGA